MDQAGYPREPASHPHSSRLRNSFKLSFLQFRTAFSTASSKAENLPLSGHCGRTFSCCTNKTVRVNFGNWPRQMRCGYCREHGGESAHGIRSPFNTEASQRLVRARFCSIFPAIAGYSSGRRRTERSNNRKHVRQRCAVSAAPAAACGPGCRVSGGNSGRDPRLFPHRGGALPGQDHTQLLEGRLALGGSCN
jgi:hypothetical protein